MPNGTSAAVTEATRLNEIGFPEFTAKLVKDVFDVLLGATLRQGVKVTKTIKVPCDCLAVSGNAAKLTFAVQDDTSVEAATLNVRGCCLKEQGKGM
jgi:hypothetical protein